MNELPSSLQTHLAEAPSDQLLLETTSRFANSSREDRSTKLWHFLSGRSSKQTDQIELSRSEDRVLARLLRNGSVVDEIGLSILQQGNFLRVNNLDLWYWEFLFLWGRRSYQRFFAYDGSDLVLIMKEDVLAFLVFWPFHSVGEKEFHFPPRF